VLLAWGLAALASYDVVADVDPTRAGLGPGAAHWLGTDHLGRDVAWRLLLGSRAFVAPATGAALVAGTLGVAAGALAGYLGGAVAVVVRYALTVTAAVPRFVLVLLCGAVLGSDPRVLAAASGVACMPAVGDAVQARLESLRDAEFVLAARAHGLGEARILLYHLLWVNCRGLVARQLLQAFGFFLVVETTLSYLGGFGVQEPTPSWGNMLAFEFGIPDGNLFAWLAPAVAIWAAILGTALLGQDLGVQEGAEADRG
jgi:peptide/nickel transport system permease protein